MPREYWATCSVYDHRQPYFRKALLLFDRVMVPVATEPVGDLTVEEIRQLSRRVDRLVQEGAAVRVDWDPKEFQAWRERGMAQSGREGLAAWLNRDRVMDTRIQLVQHATDHGLHMSGKLGRVTPVAVPVYSSRESYDAAVNDLVTAQMLLHLELADLIPVPPDDVNEDEILRLRGKAGFRDSLSQLHRWRDKVLPEVLSSGDLGDIEAAVEQYAGWNERYRDGIADARFDKIETAVVSVLAIGGATAAVVTGTAPIWAGVLGGSPGVAKALFSVRSLMRPSWKAVADKEFAPAGVVYEARRLFRNGAK